MAVGSPKSKTVTEKINPVILRLLGLEDVFDIDYDTYITLLKEILVKSQSLGTLKLADEEVALLKEELKRVKGRGKSGRFAVKTSKIPVRKPAAKPKIKVQKLLLPPSQKGGVRMLPPGKKEKAAGAQQQQMLLGGTDLKKVLSQITSSLDSILAALLEQNRETRKNTEKERRDAENRRRSARESKLESGAKALVNLGKKILAPFQSIWDKIWNWIFYTFLGKAVINMLNWFNDPKNADKVKTLGRFLKDWWPALLAGLVLFTTPFGLFVRTIIGTVARFTLQLTKFAIPSLLRFTKGAGGLAGRLLTNPFVMGTAAVAGTAVLANEVTGQRKAASVQTENKARAQTGRGVGTQGVGGVGDMGPTTPYGLLQGVRSGGFIGRAYAGGGQVFHGLVTDKTGETVSGAGPDTQFFPLLGGDGGAVLQKGEVVLQKGARERIIAETGVDPLAYNIGPNANKPRDVGGIQAASGGGLIGEKGINFVGRGSSDIQNIKKFLNKLTGLNVDRPSTWKFPSAPRTGRSSTGSLLTDPLGALRRISSRSGGGMQMPPMPSGGGIGLPSMPRIPSLPSAGGIRMPSMPKMPSIGSLAQKAKDKMGFGKDGFISNLRSATYRDAGSIYAKQMAGGMGGPISERDLSGESRAELQKAIARAKKRTGAEMRKAEAKIKELRAMGAKDGNPALETQKSFLNKLKSGGIRVQYTDYANEKGELSESAKNAKNILGQFWAYNRSKEEGGGYRIEDKYDFDKVKDPMKVLFGKGNTTQQRLQALHQMNPMRGSGNVDMVLGGKRSFGDQARLTASKLPLIGGMFGKPKTEAEKKQEFLKKNPGATLYNKPQKNTGQPYKSKFARPKKKQGGGFIGEGTGLNLFGAGADRQLIQAQPGEYMLPVDTVMRLGGKQSVDRLVAATDSNSAAAKLGTNKPNLTPPTPPVSKAGAGGMMTLPPIMGGSTAIGGGAGGSGSKREIMAFSAATAIEERKMNAEVYGIGVAPPFK